MAETESTATTIILLVVLVVALALGAIAPAVVVWNTVPPVAGEYATYVRLAAAITTAVVAVFVGTVVLQTAVDVAKDLTEDGETE